MAKYQEYKAHMKLARKRHIEKETDQGLFSMQPVKVVRAGKYTNCYTGAID